MSAHENETVDLFPVVLLNKTLKAFRFKYAGEMKWIPTSLTTSIAEDEHGNPTHIRIPYWFAEKEGYLDGDEA